MIRITRQTDYGILLLSRLSGGANGVGNETASATEDGEAYGPSYTAPELAAMASLPLPMASKILKSLVRAGILASQRGVKGGYRLVRSPAEISVADMVQALEGPIALTACVEDADGCQHASTCPAQGNWQVINRAIRDVFDRVSLADMTQGLEPDHFDRASSPPSGNGFESRTLESHMENRESNVGNPSSNSTESPEPNQPESSLQESS